jgi:hypothetical protein
VLSEGGEILPEEREALLPFREAVYEDRAVLQPYRAVLSLFRDDRSVFTAEISPFAADASRDVHLFYVGRDDVHGVLKYLLDGRVGFEGSTNWSASGEGTFVVKGRPGGPRYKARMDSAGTALRIAEIKAAAGAGPHVEQLA